MLAARGDRGAPLRLFIISKSHDWRFVADLASVLKGTFGSSIEPFGATSSPVGERWHNTIERNLTNAEAVIVLYTRVHEKWEWPAYEAGVFSGKGDANRNRVFVLHRREEPPQGPLAMHRAVAVDNPPELHEFLRNLFSSAGRMVVPGIAADDLRIRRIVDLIVEGFLQSKTAVLEFAPTLYLNFSAKQTTVLQISEIADDVAAVPNFQAASLFGLPDSSSVTWNTLLHVLQRQVPRLPVREWASEFAAVLRDAAYHPGIPIPNYPH